MPLGARILNVVLKLPNGDVILDDSLDLKVRIHKDALAIQQSCEIVVTDLSQSMREMLISRFSAWQNRNVQQGTGQSTYIGVTVQAGYETFSRNAMQTNVTTVFTGQVVTAGPVGALPNLAVRIICYSRQVDRTGWVTPDSMPAQTTFKNYVKLAAEAMGLNFVCETSYNDKVITNPGASVYNVGSLLIDLQSYYRPNVAAYIDNGTLYVKDVNKVITTANTVNVDEFINTPMWTEWGAEFECLFNPQITLACAAQLKSKMNPSLNQSAFVIYTLDYDLTSRDTAFYVKASGSPPA